ncbi:MAG: hypothetical protein FJ267_14975, partial [Planctomycetes bacterium]|nr:hypothetical protein [Planctomycetota bacterium]
MHNHSIVIGDVNQGNVLVSKHGTITLIDCDSFQVQSGDRVYPCRVGVAHFTPPELQGGSFDGLHRTIHHDRFGLAMLIFHLLCMGRHPYAGQYLGTGEPPPIEKAIANFQYVYHRKSPTAQFVPPPQSLLLPAVMPKISDLFHRAFARGSEVEGSRPSSIEWHEALRDLKSQLKPCGSDIGHKFPNYLGTCPWCELERDGAPNLFVSVTSHLVDQRENELKENTDDVWHPLVDLKDQAIAFGIERPDYHTLKVVPTPIPEEVSQTDALAKLVGRVLVMCLITFVASMWIEPLFLISVTLSIGFGFWWIILVTTFGSKRERNRRERHRDEVIATLRNLEKDSATQWEEARRQFLRRFEGLELLKTEIDGLWTRYTADLDQLSMQRERRQLDAFLQSYLIREASIPLIAEWRKETLASFGVETAFDINEIRIL